MNEELQHKIEAYLQGKMTAQEKSAFETAMDQDADLAQEVQIAREMETYFSDSESTASVPDNEHTAALRNFLRGEEAEEVRKQLAAAKDSYAVDDAQNSKRFWINPIAAVLVVALLGTFAWNYFGSSSNADLYQQYYSDSDLPSLVQRDGGQDNLIKGVELFQKGEYQEALEAFDAYESGASELDTGVYLYQGVTHARLQQWGEALRHFDQMIQLGSLDASRGLWLKALTYLQMDQPDQAKPLLDQLINDSDFNANKAQELRDELD